MFALAWIVRRIFIVLARLFKSVFLNGRRILKLERLEGKVIRWKSMYQRDFRNYLSSKKWKALRKLKTGLFMVDEVFIRTDQGMQASIIKVDFMRWEVFCGVYRPTYFEEPVSCVRLSLDRILTPGKIHLKLRRWLSWIRYQSNVIRTITKD